MKIELGNNFCMLIVYLAIIAFLCYGCHELVQEDIAEVKAKTAQPK